MSFLSITASESLRAEWHSLRDDITPWIGERATTLFAHAVCDAYDCLPLALHFRKLLVDAGDDPDLPQVTEAEQLLIDWGRAIADRPHGLSAEFYESLEASFVPERRRTLLAFAAQTVAACVTVTVGRVPVDDDLLRYRRAGDGRTA
jgi:hypothetical protein